MVPELATGYSKTYTTKNMALVKVRIGSSAPGVDGIVKAYGELANGGVDPAFTVQPLTGTRKVYLSTDDDAVWNIVAGVLGEKDPAGDRQIEAAYSLDTARRFEPGTTHTETFHAGVMGPQIKPGDGLVRDGDNLYGSLALVSDGPGHPGFARYAGATTTIHRDGVLYAKEDAAIDERFFALPPESATYKVATTINRNPVVYRMRHPDRRLVDLHLGPHRDPCDAAGLHGPFPAAARTGLHRGGGLEADVPRRGAGRGGRRPASSRCG